MINKKTINEVQQRLVKLYNPESIYIFGSYAWGKPDPESDLDILVVVDNYTKDRLQMITDGFKALHELGIFKDILVYSKKDFEKCSSDHTTICNRIIKEGKKVYAKA